MNNEAKLEEDDILALMDYRQDWRTRMQIAEDLSLMLTEAIIEAGLTDSNDGVKRVWINRDDYKPTKAQIKRGIEEGFAQSVDWLNKIEKYGMHQECVDLIAYLGVNGDFTAKNAVAEYYINTKRDDVKPTADDIIRGVTDENLGIAFAWLNNERNFFYSIIEEEFGAEAPVKIDEAHKKISKINQRVAEMFFAKMNSDRAHCTAIKRTAFDTDHEGVVDQNKRRSRHDFNQDLI